ncbi:26S proteasome non-ATPase regulatory subunit 5-like [Asterias amurensis]|uniref:26S proteasome non-ATPase regulatory subunit 5-like n=1 Tax=Asterias amurensis TaxID=7602 RepID=UPI003AB6FE44
MASNSNNVNGSAMSATNLSTTDDPSSVHLLKLLEQGFNSNTNKSLLLLIDFRTALTAVTQTQLRTFVRNVSLQPLFACLKISTTSTCCSSSITTSSSSKARSTSYSETDREKHSVIGAILSKIFDCMEADVILNQFREELLLCLDHSNESIQLVCLKQVKRIAGDIKCLSEVEALCNDVGLLTSIITRIGDDCLLVAQEASFTLDAICSNHIMAVHFIFSGSLLGHIGRVASKGDIVKYRFFELATKVATYSSESMMVIGNCGLLQDLILDLNTDDELIQMNSIEMLSNLVCSKHGLLYMNQQGVLSTIENMLIASEVKPILLPSLFRFFITICKAESSEVSLLPNCFLKLSLDLLGSHDMSLVANAVDAVNVVGLSVEGKEALLKQGLLMNEGLAQMGLIIQRPPVEVRIRSLMALANLFSLRDDEQTSGMLSILEQWFMKISNNSLQTILAICQQPFPELKCAALSVLKALANQEWAQRLMNQHCGFHEYLLDRKTEHEQTGKHAKYDVIKVLAKSSTSAHTFGRPFVLKMMEYVKEGPLYKIVQSKVALQD